MSESDFYRRLLDRLKSLDTFLLTTHRKADPDGLGAELGLDHLLREMGKDCVIINPDPLLDKYRFIDKENRVSDFFGHTNAGSLSSRTVVVLDNSDLDRTGDVKRFIRDDLSNLLVIDHHDGAHPDYHTYFQNPDIGSTSELIFELYEAAGMDIPLHVAEAIYAGIVADTGHFRYRKTRPRTHRIAAKLLEVGVDTARLADQLFAVAPVGRLHLKRKLYSQFQLNKEETVGWFKIRREDVDELGMSFDDLDGIVNELIEPDKIKVGLLFTQREPRLTRVSVRSRGDVNMLPAVEPYGGGGHKNACGATIQLDLENAVKEFIPIAAACVKASGEVKVT